MVAKLIYNAAQCTYLFIYVCIYSERSLKGASLT